MALPPAGVIGAMIWNSHASHVARNQEALMRLEEDVRGMAATLGHFFFERSNDMRIVVDNRQVRTFFEQGPGHVRGIRRRPADWAIVRTFRPSSGTAAPRLLGLPAA